MSASKSTAWTLAAIIAAIFFLEIRNVAGEDDLFPERKPFVKPPRVIKDMADKFKTLPDKPNYREEGVSRPGAGKTAKAKSTVGHPRGVEVSFDGSVFDSEGALSDEERAHAALTALDENWRQVEAEERRMEAERRAMEEEEHRAIEEERKAKRARAPAEFRKRVERIRSMAARAFGDDSIELTKIHAELEVLRRDLQPVDLAAAGLGRGGKRGDGGGRKGNAARPAPEDGLDEGASGLWGDGQGEGGPNSGGRGAGPEAPVVTADEATNVATDATLGAKSEDPVRLAHVDRLARLWALERRVLERAAGYAPEDGEGGG